MEHGKLNKIILKTSASVEFFVSFLVLFADRFSVGEFGNVEVDSCGLCVAF